MKRKKNNNNNKNPKNVLPYRGNRMCNGPEAKKFND
jgi:hypothetical protein